MTKQMLKLLDDILSSTARTVRAVALILVVTVAASVAPTMNALVPQRPAVSVPSPASVR